MKLYKDIAYAHPSSVNAIKYGHSALGCWTLDLRPEHGDEIQNLGAWYYRHDAIAAAEALPNEYHHWSFKPWKAAAVA